MDRTIKHTSNTTNTHIWREKLMLLSSIAFASLCFPIPFTPTNWTIEGNKHFQLIRVHMKIPQAFNKLWREREMKRIPLQGKGYNAGSPVSLLDFSWEVCWIGKELLVCPTSWILRFPRNVCAFEYTNYCLVHKTLAQSRLDLWASHTLTCGYIFNMAAKKKKVARDQKVTVVFNEDARR